MSHSVKNLDLNPTKKDEFMDTNFVQAIAASMAYPTTFSAVKMASTGATYNSAE